MSRAPYQKPLTKRWCSAFGPQRQLNKASQCLNPNAAAPQRDHWPSGRRFMLIQRPWWKCAWPFGAKASHEHVRLGMALFAVSDCPVQHATPRLAVQKRTDLGEATKAIQRPRLEMLWFRVQTSFPTAVQDIVSPPAAATAQKATAVVQPAGALLPLNIYSCAETSGPLSRRGSHVPFHWPANSGGACPRPIRQLGRQIGARPVFHVQWLRLVAIPACRSLPPPPR
jgi:hypothetical protein